MDFGSLVYPGLRHPILEAKHHPRHLHSIYTNRERLRQLKRAQDPLCTFKACHREERKLHKLSTISNEKNTDVKIPQELERGWGFVPIGELHGESGQDNGGKQRGAVHWVCEGPAGFQINCCGEQSYPKFKQYWDTNILTFFFLQCRNTL